MDVSTGILVAGGVLIALIGRYGLRHADDRRDSSGGVGSWMAPDTRRFWSLALIVIGLGSAAIAAFS